MRSVQIVRCNSVVRGTLNCGAVASKQPANLFETMIVSQISGIAPTNFVAGNTDKFMASDLSLYGFQSNDRYFIKMSTVVIILKYKI